MMKLFSKKIFILFFLSLFLVFSISPLTAIAQPLQPIYQCNDTIDNDSDGDVDMADSDCTGPGDDSEGSAATTDFVGGILSSIGGLLAGIIGWLLSGITEGLFRIFNFFTFALLFIPAIALGILVAISGLIAGIVVALLQWVIEVIVNVPVLPPVDPMTGEPLKTVVLVGWTFTRDFVNMLFILILAFIGLATILKLETYGVKKTLPLLILMALLVNFSLVFVGLLVDFGNLINNFFIGKIGGEIPWYQGFKVAIQYYYFLIKAVLGSIYSGFSMNLLFQNIAYGLSLIAINLGAILIFGAAALIFLLRIVALWLLAIFAPFAFAAYILPATRGFWNSWWNQLIMWSFVGLPVLFCLYLAAYLSNNFEVSWGGPLSPIPLDTDIRTLPPGAPTIAPFTDLGTALVFTVIQPLMSMIIMVIGILAAISFTPHAGKITSYGAAGAGWVASRRPVASWMGKQAEKTEKKLGEAAEWMKKQELKAGKLGILIKPGTEAAKWAHGLAGGELLKYAAETRKTPVPKGFDEWDAELQARYIDITPDLTQEDKGRLYARMANLGTFKDAERISGFKEKATTARKKMMEDPRLKEYVNEISKAIPESVTEGVLMALTASEEQEEMRGRITKLAEERARKSGRPIALNEEGRLILTPEEKNLAAARIFAEKLSPQDIRKLSIRAATSQSVRESTKGWGPSQFRAAIDTYSNEVLKKMFSEGGANDISTMDEFQKLKKENPQLVKFSQQYAGRIYLPNVAALADKSDRLEKAAQEAQEAAQEAQKAAKKQQPPPPPPPPPPPQQPPPPPPPPRQPPQQPPPPPPPSQPSQKTTGTEIPMAPPMKIKKEEKKKVEPGAEPKMEPMGKPKPEEKIEPPKKPISGEEFLERLRTRATREHISDELEHEKATKKSLTEAISELKKKKQDSKTEQRLLELTEKKIQRLTEEHQKINKEIEEKKWGE